MFKTERGHNLDSRYDNSKDSVVSSKYLMDSKKKYYLASSDQNLGQLKEEQAKNLTSVLIELKAEYDEMIRETTIRKKETENIGKQIEMLDKMEKKTKNKQMVMEENFTNMETLIELKKARRDQEAYSRDTYLGLIQKMKEEIHVMRKDLALCEQESERLKKKQEKEKLNENIIKEKINQVYSKISNKKAKLNQEKSENNIMIQYYNNIIDQKWSFINSADERKAKQAKIALQAKNDTQDGQEKEKRKLLFLYMLYDKFLRRKMEKELKENELMEGTFQTIKDITGTSSLKSMVEKILNKDKNYNLCVSKVADKQDRITILNKEIANLEKENQNLKNNIIDEESKSTVNSTITNSGMLPANIEEEDANLLSEEKELMDELKQLQEKHKNVILVYEKVIDNIKQLCRIETKKEDTSISANILNNSNLNESKNLEINNNSNSIPLEEELLKSYCEFLEILKKRMEPLFMNHSKQEFLSMVRDKGVKPVQSNKTIQNKSNKRIIMHPGTEKKVVTKEVVITNNNPTNAVENNNLNEEYDYSDEDVRKVDDIIKKDQDEIIKEYMIIEKNKLSEAMKLDKDKK